MNFSLHLGSRDDAALTDPVGEVRRALEHVLRQFNGEVAPAPGGSLLDTNGNQIGQWRYQQLNDPLRS